MSGELTSTEFLELPTDDGPVVEVGRTSMHTTIRFDWTTIQRWYLTPDEARRIAAALIQSADAVVEGQDVTPAC